jgi:hypothetical protein
LFFKKNLKGFRVRMMNRENGEGDINPSSPQSSPPMEERRKHLLPSGEKAGMRG